MFAHRLRVSRQGGEVIEGVGLGVLAGEDQTHEEVADPGSHQSFVEEGVFAMPYGFLEHLLTNVVVQGGSGLAQEQGQGLPMFEQVLEGLAQAGVRFDLVGVQLGLHPSMQRLHDRAALGLMELETSLRREAILLGQGVEVVNLAEALQDLAALGGEILDEVDELAPAMAIIPTEFLSRAGFVGTVQNGGKVVESLLIKRGSF